MAARQRHLRNAPIREGLVDIQFDPVPLDRVGAFAEEVKGSFKEATALWQAAFGLQLGANGAPVQDQGTSQVGYRLTDPQHVLLLRTNGFTFSRLPPYEEWSELRNAASALWERFVRSTRPTGVSRIAVRYVNVLPLPLGNEQFSRFLETAPEIPEGLPQTVGSFLHRVVLVDAEHNRQAIVTQALEEAQLVDGRASVFLDIDVFRACHLNPDAPELWQGLDNLRDFKNSIFFGLITEETARLFE